ncbi:MAG: hypothetical protein VXX58_05570, partial [Pseudomonadota bacterium]|nr:hypothetical protein [Pseudomonadota bacterium]
MMLGYCQNSIFKTLAAMLRRRLRMYGRMGVIAGMIMTVMTAIIPPAMANIKLVEVKVEGIGSTQRDAILDGLKIA